MTSSRGGAAPRKRGTAFEATVVAALRRNGWALAHRAYASKGAWDVLAIRRKGHPYFQPLVWLVQAKVGGYMGPKERERLLALAQATGGKAVMITVENRRLRAFKITTDSCRAQEVALTGETHVERDESSVGIAAAAPTEVPPVW